MPKIFPLVKKIVQVVGGAINFRVSQKPGIAISTRNSGTAALPVAVAGVSVEQAPSALRARQRPAVAVESWNTGSAHANQAAGVKVGSRLALTPGPLQKPGIEVVHIKVDLTHRSGSNAVTQTAQGGRTDWTNIANAEGRRNGTLASIAGNTLAARGGQLVCNYANFPGKSTLTILSVQLHFYVRQAGTVLNNGNLVLLYNLNDGAGDVSLETITSNVDSLTTPRTFDITAGVASWANLDGLHAKVRFNSAIAEVFTADCDAVELEIIATRTDAA